MPCNGLPKEEILRTLGAIDALFTGGRRTSSMPIRCVWRTLGPEEFPSEANVEVLFSVPKKFFKRANKRNLLRRRMKESYRLSKHALVESVAAKGARLHIALIYSSKELSDYATINEAVNRILEQICGRL
ncbi:MAG: ribonuclease P [Rikenellaceae bacterium]|nr:ribonuclease P [Rikenellaceae bacterium]